MISIEQLLEKKGRQIWTISKESTVFDCIQLMDEKNVGALIVTHEGKMAGIVSERDYARKVILRDRSSKETRVSEIMTENVYSAFPELPVDECLVMMNEKRIRHVPVVASGQPVGMISVGDVVKEIIEEQQYTIQVLEENISWAETY